MSGGGYETATVLRVSRRGSPPALRFWTRTPSCWRSAACRRPGRRCNPREVRRQRHQGREGTGGRSGSEGGAEQQEQPTSASADPAPLLAQGQVMRHRHRPPSPRRTRARAKPRKAKANAAAALRASALPIRESEDEDSPTSLRQRGDRRAADGGGALAGAESSPGCRAQRLRRRRSPSRSPRRAGR